MSATLGDPGEMRAEASALSSRAEAVAEIAQRLSSQAVGIEFEGPAADQFRQEMASQTLRAVLVAEALQTASAALLQAATLVEEEIAAAMTAGGGSVT